MMNVNERRVNEQSAGYMELPGAVRDANCEVVEVAGGVSKKLGCCNLFWPEDEATTKVFSCGTCEYVTKQADQTGEPKPLSKREARGMDFLDVINSDRPASEEK